MAGEDVERIRTYWHQKSFSGSLGLFHSLALFCCNNAVALFWLLAGSITVGDFDNLSRMPTEIANYGIRVANCRKVFSRASIPAQHCFLLVWRERSVWR